MFELHEVVIFVVWSVVVWGMGWYAHKGKCEREKRGEELRLAITDSMVYGSGWMKDGKHVRPEDIFSDDYDLESGK